MLVRTINNIFFCFLLLLTFFVCTNIYAAQKDHAVIIANTKLEFHQEMINSMYTRTKFLRENTGKAIVIDVNQSKSYLRNSLQNYNLIITVGTEATAKIMSLQSKVPVYSVAIPRLSYDELRQRYATEIAKNKHDGFSALYLDQPIARRFDLIQEIIPEIKTVGIVLGPATQNYANEFQTIVKRRNLQLQIGNVTQESEIINTLDRVLEKSDVMLGIVDPLVFNRVSARNVLLTAYRWRVPLIGISPSYVKAGALASVYTTPSQIGQQLAETLEQFWHSTDPMLPKPQYPKYYNVAVNYQVAEFLGIHADSEDKIKKKLSQKWSSEQ